MLKYEVNQEVLEQARNGEVDPAFKLRYPVRIRLLTDGPNGMAGKYHGLGHYGPTTDERLDEPHHHISLAGDLNANFANVALWHELTHAFQSERFLPFEQNGEPMYKEANRGLAMSFREEMKAIRAKSHTTSKSLTMSYGDVSFEVEARDVADKLSKQATLLTPLVAEQEDGDSRKLWRCDCWLDIRERTDKKGRPTGKKIGEEFFGTYYVLAEKDWEAKRFARKEWLDDDFSNTEVDTIQVRNTPKGGDE